MNANARFVKISAERKEEAYDRGESDARRYDGDTDRAPANPYGSRTVEGKRYTDGWNAWVSRQFS